MGNTIKISDPLQPMVDAYMKKRRYANNAQAANELIRIALELEDLEVEERKNAE